MQAVVDFLSLRSYSKGCYGTHYRVSSPNTNVARLAVNNLSHLSLSPSLPPPLSLPPSLFSLPLSPVLLFLSVAILFFFLSNQKPHFLYFSLSLFHKSKADPITLVLPVAHRACKLNCLSIVFRAFKCCIRQQVFIGRLYSYYH